MPRGEQNAIEFAFQSLNPCAQSRGTSDSKAGEQMNVIGHEHVSADADAKIGCAPTIFDEGLMYFGPGEQTRTSMSVERYKINRRIGALKNQIPIAATYLGTPASQRTLYPALNPALKLECCSVRCPQRIRSFHEELR